MFCFPIVCRVILPLLFILSTYSQEKDNFKRNSCLSLLNEQSSASENNKAFQKSKAFQI